MGKFLVCICNGTLFKIYFYVFTGYRRCKCNAVNDKITRYRSFRDYSNCTVYKNGTLPCISAKLSMETLPTSDLELEQKKSKKSKNRMDNSSSKEQLKKRKSGYLPNNSPKDQS